MCFLQCGFFSLSRNRLHQHFYERAIMCTTKHLSRIYKEIFRILNKIKLKVRTLFVREHVHSNSSQLQSQLFHVTVAYLPEV